MKRFLPLVLLFVVSGCTQEEVESTSRSLGETLAEMTVSQIGTLASQILDDPAAAESLLEASGIELPALDSIMYDIASDPERRAEYLAALGR